MFLMLRLLNKKHGGQINYNNNKNDNNNYVNNNYYNKRNSI